MAMGSAKALADFKRKVSANEAAGALQAYGNSGKFLPPELRNAGPTIGAGLAGIGQMIRNPGQISPTALKDVQPRLSAEFGTIGQNYDNLRSESAGAAARGNLSPSIKGALQNALGTSQRRAEQGATATALADSDQARHQNLDQTYKLLETLMQFISSGRGMATQAGGAANALSSQAGQTEHAGNAALIGSLLQAFGGMRSAPPDQAPTGFMGGP